MPKCINDNKKSYQGTEPSPKGLGYCAHAEKVGKERKGKDNNIWINKKTKNYVRWFRKNQKKTVKRKSYYFDNIEKVNFDKLPDFCYTHYYTPTVKKIRRENRIHEKFGGVMPFFVKGEVWPIDIKGRPMTFFCQFKNPDQKKNILYRVFISIYEDVWEYELPDYHHITKIDLDKNSNKIDHSILVPEKLKNGNKLNYVPLIFPCYQITKWKKEKELIYSLDLMKKMNIVSYSFGKDKKIKLQNTRKTDLFYQKYESSKFYPTSGIKIGGTPIGTQNQDYIQPYKLIQLEETKFLPFMWGDTGVAHVSDKLKLIWDCS
jgi:uncharacterized protein YwqG